jgi:Spy/CpxP family protein refolding chaperone
MYFIGPVILGAFIGLAASRAIRRHRFGHHHGGCGRFRHGFGGFGGFGFGHGFGHGFMGGPGFGRRAFFFLRELELSREQVGQLRQVYLGAKNAISSVRASRFEAVHGAIDAALAEPFDRTRVEDVAKKLGDDQGQAARELGDAIARGLEILTPEQRAKIRERFGRFGAGMGGGPDGGPYRNRGFYV